MVDASIPVRANRVLFGLLIAVNLGAAFLLPLVLLPLSPWWGLLLILPVVTTPTLWALIHEAIHGTAHPDRAVNDRMGSWLGGVFGAPFQILRLGHLMHHRFNRTELNRIEVSETAPPRPMDRLEYYLRLFGGLYVVELAAAPLALLPEGPRRRLLEAAFAGELPGGRGMWRAAEKQLLEEPGRSRLRREGLAITLGVVLAFAVWGAFWWMLALALAGRALIVSLSDNAYHYGNPLDDPISGSDLRLPTPIRLLMLNFNFHGTHHQRPSLPWVALPAAFDDLGRSYADDFAPAMLRQLRGPIPVAALIGGDGAREAAISPIARADQTD